MGTHPIFESDFDCLTESLIKTLLNKMAENPSSPKQNGKAKKKKNRKEAKNTDEAYRTSVKNKVGQKVGSTSVASTSAGPPNPILDPLGDDKDFPDSEVVWENARRIDNPYNGLYFQGRTLKCKVFEILLFKQRKSR